MARPRLVSDLQVFAAIRHLLANGGDKALSFGAAAQVCGLSAPTLVQRYGTREGMIRAALLDAWDQIDAATDAADQAEPTPQGFLKALGLAIEPVANPAELALHLRDDAIRQRAEDWRGAVEVRLTQKLGNGAKAREGALILFAAWQGQLLWQSAGGKVFRVKDAVKRLG